jgi:hypothetical protein
MYIKNGLLAGLAAVLLLTGCKEYWEEHYDTKPPTVDQNVWDAVQNENNLSLFVQYVKGLRYDTLFLKDNAYTLFVPDNEAFTQMLDTAHITSSVMDYHISVHYLQSGNVHGTRKIQTLAEKFALFNNTGNGIFFDDIPISFESPLYKNGKYFILEEVAFAKPNIYEFYGKNNPILKNYIDRQDSVILDKEKSRPVGFDSLGNTIYDTVSEIYNKFEALYFPVRKEFRNKTATIVFPKEEDYNAALTEMAISLQTPNLDYKDIPLEWQYTRLIPYLLKQGVFENMLEESFFINPYPADTFRLKNILGDSIIIDYQPIEKAICSNGYTYNYENFHIPDTLFTGSVKWEGEWMLNEQGINKFVWIDSVSVTSDVSFLPYQEYISTASNDTIIKVNFTPGYAGKFILEFNVRNLLPRKYLMVVGTHTEVGGIYDVYINNELVKTIDYYDYTLNRGVYKSVTGKRIKPVGSFNVFDCWVENLTEYNQALMRIEYKGPGRVRINGLIIDYIEFFPAASVETR